MGFEQFKVDVEDVLQEHKKQQKVFVHVHYLLNVPLTAWHRLSQQEREKKVSKLDQSGMTEEELLQAQEALFAASREQYQNQAQP